MQLTITSLKNNENYCASTTIYMALRIDTNN